MLSLERSFDILFHQLSSNPYLQSHLLLEMIGFY